MIAPTPFFADRGCHVRIFEEARILISLGHRVEIVTYHIGRDMPGIIAHRIPSIPWYQKLDAGPSWHKLYLDILLFFTAVNVARRLKPDLFHAHLHEGAFVGVLLKVILNIPLLFDYQGSLSGEVIDHGFCRKGSLLARFFGWIESRINRSADVIVTSSSLATDDLIGKWGVPKQSVTTLADAVNTDEFKPFDQKESRLILNLPADVPVVAFLGVFNRYQGVDLLLEAIAILKLRAVTVHFLLMGFPDERYRLRAEEMGLGGMITFTGKVDYKDAPFYLSAADLAVSPKISLTEANGKLFNYLACGLPALVFDTPVNREILGDVGVYAQFADVTDFATKLEELIADPDRMHLLGQKGREKAVLEHSWTSRGGCLVKRYQDLIGRRS